MGAVTYLYERWNFGIILLFLSNSAKEELKCWFGGRDPATHLLYNIVS